MKRQVLASLASLAAILLLSACGGWKLPEDFTGPTASLVASSGDPGLVRRAEFSVNQINGSKAGWGHQVPWPHWLDPAKTTHTTGYLVPAGKPLTVTIEGKDKLPDLAQSGEGALLGFTAERVIGVFSRPRQSVHGDVTFTPEPDRYYRVDGQLTKESSSVWIESYPGKQRVSERVTSGE